MTALVQGAGRAPQPQSVRVVAFYEPDTGQIRHVHTIVVFKGAKPVSEAEAIARAKTHAMRAGPHFR